MAQKDEREPRILSTLRSPSREGAENGLMDGEANEEAGECSELACVQISESFASPRGGHQMIYDARALGGRRYVGPPPAQSGNIARCIARDRLVLIVDNGAHDPPATVPDIRQIAVLIVEILAVCRVRPKI